MKYTESDRFVKICHHYLNASVWVRHSTFTVTDGIASAFTSLSMACCEEKDENRVNSVLHMNEWTQWTQYYFPTINSVNRELTVKDLSFLWQIKIHKIHFWVPSENVKPLFEIACKKDSKRSWMLCI